MIRVDAPLPNTFALARYRLHGVVEGTLRFDDFAGSALRGAFGHALKRMVCATRMEDCRACPLYRTCSYPAIFDPPSPPDARTPQQIPPPYVIEPPPPGPLALNRGAPFVFDVVLIGTALAHLPLIISAWRTALANGIGPDGRVRLVRVCDEHDKPLLDLAANQLQQHEQTVTLPPTPTELARVTLDFTIPFSFSRSGRALQPAQLSPADLLMALVRRTATLSEQHLGNRLAINFSALKEATEAVEGKADWRQLRWQCYSNRQRRAMPLEGSIGQWHLTGELAPFWPYLYLGQWLHVGKKCSLGFGRYQLTFPSQDCY